MEKNNITMLCKGCKGYFVYQKGNLKHEQGFCGICEIQDTKKLNSLEKQIGGEHYKHFKIQPVEFIMKNNLSFLGGCVVKRICRKKGNRIEDLKKAIHEIEMMIELE